MPLYFSTAENTPQGECIYHRTREEKQKGIDRKVIACRIKGQMKSFIQLNKEGFYGKSKAIFSAILAGMLIGMGEPCSFRSQIR